MPMESIRTIDPGQETFKAAESVAWPRRAPLFSQATLQPDIPLGLIHDKSGTAYLQTFPAKRQRYAKYSSAEESYAYQREWCC